MPDDKMTQTAPYPYALAAQIAQLRHRPGYEPALHDDLDRGQGCRGMTFVVTITCPDAYHPERLRSVAHYFPVPAAAYDERSWRRWVFDCLSDISLHEDMEHFEIDGERPYAPNHGPGRNPYVLHEVGLDVDQRTSFRGEVKEPSVVGEAPRGFPGYEPCPDEFSEDD